jgi:hypothetical protein
MAHLNGRDPEWLTNLVVDAYAIGELAAAKRNGVSRSTVCRAKTKVKDDPALAAMVKEKLAESSHDLGILRVQFLREALAAATLKLPSATLYETAGAIKIVGELHQTAMMVGDDDELQPDTESEVSAEAEGGSGGVSSEADGTPAARH